MRRKWSFDKQIRADVEFSEELEEIKLNRIKKGKDKRMRSDRRLTAAIRRHPLFRDIKADIEISDLKDDRKGSVIDIVMWIVISFVILLLMGTWLYGHGVMTDALVNIASPNDAVNISEAASLTLGRIDAALPVLRWAAFGIILALGISIMISNFLVKAHPVFLIIYIFIAIVAVVFAVYVSNIYETTILTNSAIGETMMSFTAGSWIMLNLPIWTAVIGIFGAILLFAGIIRSKETGGSPI